MQEPCLRVTDSGLDANEFGGSHLGDQRANLKRHTKQLQIAFGSLDYLRKLLLSLGSKHINST
jgi:hypothetical protein